VSALGNAIEVEAQVRAKRDRSDAISFLQQALDLYNGTAIHKKIQKNINLLSLEGHPAPSLDVAEFIGRKPPTLARLKGKVVVLFFWAHWCPDCKIESPILAGVFAKYRARGLAIIAPTQRYGYVAGGAAAGPEEELRYIVQVRDTYYRFLRTCPSR
jgi:thiol-disulfide isomerase/thioredoxin